MSSISPSLYDEIITAVARLQKRETQAELNRDLFWLLSSQGWSFDARPQKVADNPPDDLGINTCFSEIRSRNSRELCRTSTTVDANWHADFAKRHCGGLVQIEAQFGTVESMFKDFCGFRIAYYERRLALGIELVLVSPNLFFSQRKNSVTGMAYYDIAVKTMMAIGLDCPIWLVGIEATM